MSWNICVEEIINSVALDSSLSSKMNASHL